MEKMLFTKARENMPKNILIKKIVGTTWIKPQSITKIFKSWVHGDTYYIFEWKIWILLKFLFFQSQFIDLLKYKILK